MFQEQCVFNKEKISFFHSQMQARHKAQSQRRQETVGYFLINSFIKQIFFENHALSNTVLLPSGIRGYARHRRFTITKLAVYKETVKKKNQTTSYCGMYSIETLGCS